MILTCPDCGTQYVVKDGTIPPEGRQVRCAACKHSWHQDPENAPPPVPASEPVAAIEAEPAPAIVSDETAPVKAVDAEEETIAESMMIDPRSGPEAEERAYEAAAIEDAVAEPAAVPMTEPDFGEPIAAAEPATVAEDWNPPPHAQAAPDSFSPFADEAEEAPRRRGPLLLFLVVLLVVALAAGVYFFAPPDIKGKLGLATDADSPLALVTTHMDRQRLESGNELLTVTGRVINPTGKEQNVPPLNAQLRTKAGKVVYSWTISPPARSLPAGASASFNSAEVNVPPGGEELTISLGDS